MHVLAPKRSQWPGEAFTEQQIWDKLTYWREHLVEFRAGKSNSVVTLAEILRALDRWLDERLALRGR